MALVQYLAMTAAEMLGNSCLPEKIAWMACHFSPYSTGLCNLPASLPPGSLLILNDRTPIHGHSAPRVCEELAQTLRRLDCRGLLLDFQNPPCAEATELAAYLAAHLDFPMGISPEYACENAAVFVPAVPTDTRLSAYLHRWQGREIWLEAALEGQTITLTQEGTAFRSNPFPMGKPFHRDERLHCHYQIENRPDAIIFRTWRTKKDLQDLLAEAAQEGVTLSVGLYQELAEPQCLSGE